MLEPTASPQFLSGQVVLLTGASRGIGEALAHQLAAAGATLMLSARNQQALETLATALKIQHPACQVKVHPCDVQDTQACITLVESTIKQFGQIDVLINNAGIGGKVGLLSEMPLAQLEAMLDTNLKAPLVLAHAVLVGMAARQSGVIVNINSVAGKTAFPFWAVYDATKAGLKAATEALAEEQRSNGIKVLGIYPGAVDTTIWDSLDLQDNPNREGMLNPEDVAKAVLYALNQPAGVFVSDITLQPTIPAL
jgi:short-subunit dehydrogenase